MSNSNISEAQAVQISSKTMWRAGRAFLRYCLKKWHIFILSGLLGGLLGVGFAWLQTPKYESRLTFALEDGKGGLGAALGLASELGFGINLSNQSIFEGENILTIIKSRRIIERVLLQTDTLKGKQVTLIEKWLYINKVNLKKNKRFKSVSFPVGQDRSSFHYLQDSILFNVYDDIVKTRLAASRPDRKLNIYEIRFNSPNEYFSKFFVEKLIDETVRFYTELRTKKSKETLQILEQRVGEVKGSAKGAIDEQAGIKDANINPAFNAAAASVIKRQLDVSAYGRAYEELFKNLEVARYQYLNDIPLLQIIDEPRYPLKRIKAGRLKTGIIWAFLAGILASLYLFRKWSDKGKVQETNAAEPANV